MDQPTNLINLTRPLACVDTEWTELDPQQRRIVSIAVVRFEPDNTQETGYWLVNPKQAISPEATKVHGIRQEDVANQPEFSDIAGEVEAILLGADIAGYSVTGDLEIIEKEMNIAGREWSADGRNIVDAYRIWLAREPRTLSDAHRRFVGPVPDSTQAHDARHDVNMTIAVLNALHDGKTASELHREAYPDMVDTAGKFKRQDGTIVFNFGPHRGQPASRHPDFLQWMLSKDFPQSTLNVADQLLDELEN